MVRKSQRYTRLFIYLAVCQLFIFSRGLTEIKGFSERMSGRQSIDSYETQLKDPDVATRTDAATEIGVAWSTSDEVIPLLGSVLKNDKEPKVRIAAAASLGNMANKVMAISYLRSALQNRTEQTNPKVRKAVASALGGMLSEPQVVLQILGEALSEEPEVNVRSEIIISVGRFKARAKRAIPALVEEFNTSLSNEKTKLREKEEYKIANPQPADVTDLSYNTQIWNKFEPPLLDLDAERMRIVESLALISTGLVEEQDTTSIGQLKQAYSEIEKDEKLSIKKVTVAETVAAYETIDTYTKTQIQRLADNISRLEAIERSQLLPTLYRTTFSIILPFVILTTVWLILLWLRPLWLFRINEFLAFLPEIKVEKLGGISLSVRYLTVVGFFHYHGRVLNAWVSEHLEKGRSHFKQKPTVADRAVHVPLSLFLGGTLVDEFKVDNFRDIYAQHHSLLLIFGEGGAGKTSLACQFASWAMSEVSHERLCQSHPMLPILIEHDFENSSIEHDFENSLLREIGNQLKDMTDSVEAPPRQLIKQLLKKRRVLVVVDGMSEMNEATRSSILYGLTELPVNAMIFTSRFDEALKGLSKSVIEPIRLQNANVDEFMQTYLHKLDKDKLFSADEIQRRCASLHEMVGEGRDLTVILAKYYVVNMIAAKEEHDSKELPENVPYLMLNYIRLLNRKSGPNDPDNNTLIGVAEVIAWECLKTKYRPMPAKFDDVLEALCNRQEQLLFLRNTSDQKEKIEKIRHTTKYMELNLRLLKTSGARQDQIRFALDTLSEYMAGLFLIREYGSNEKVWSDFLVSTDERIVDPKVVQRALRDKVIDYKEVLPEEILSFLLALYDCCLTQEASGLVPDFVPEELKRRIIIRRIIKDLRSSNAQSRWQALKEFEQTEAVAYGLTQKFIVPKIIELLIDNHAEVRNTARKILIDLGDLAIPTLTEASQREESEVGITARQVLSKIHRKVTKDEGSILEWIPTT